MYPAGQEQSDNLLAPKHYKHMFLVGVQVLHVSVVQRTQLNVKESVIKKVSMYPAGQEQSDNLLFPKH